MCGISGIASKRLSPGDVANAITRMTQTLRHRGPDGTGTRNFLPPDSSCPVSLGHNRLSIIDVSAAGREPMCNEDESIWLVFNGEVYNFPELRAKLEAQGHNFRSHTDAEVIIHLYEEDGPNCAAKLNGIFAFAILDLRQDRLLLVRDPIGVKPLYYCRTPDHFLFGSEIKTILACSLFENKVNWQAISDYFTYLYIPGPETAFEGLFQLPPGCRLLLNLRDLSERLERYWSVRRREELETATYDDMKLLIRDRLAASVKRQLVSDVPLGVFLSGGVDSTIVAGLAKQQQADIRTFTVIFEGDEYRFYNEAETSRAVSQHLGTVHRELVVSRSEPADVLDLVEFFDQPFANPTSYLMHLLSQSAREHITVALCGAGGDELFAGYPRYNAVRLARRLDWMPRSFLHLGSKALEIVRDSFRTMHLKRARKFLEGLDSDFCVQYAQWTYFLNEKKKAQLLLRRPESLQPQNHHEASTRILRHALEQSALKDIDNQVLHMDLQTFLVDNVLEYTDKMSMAVGLEVRVPLLDPEFVEVSLNAPFAYKVRSGAPKMLLSDAFAEFFPPVARAAPKKGFNAPLAHWIISVFDSYFEVGQPSRHATRKQSADDIGISWREGILDWNFIDRLRRQHRRGQRDNSYELFSFIVFDVWWRKYIARTSPMRFW
jgi:asparagine synthase (glutamine-hydrolysing)